MINSINVDHVSKDNIVFLMKVPYKSFLADSVISVMIVV